MMKTDSFFKRIFLIIVTVFMLGVGILVYTVINIQQSSLQDVMYSKAMTTAKSISLVSSDAMITEDYSFLVEFIEKVIGDNKEILFTIISKKNGQSLYSTPTSWSLLSKLPKKIQALQTPRTNGKIIYDVFGQDEVYCFTYPVVFSGIEWGWISIGYSLKQYKENMRTIYVNSVLLLTIIFFIALLLSYLLTKWIVKPIIQLNYAVQDVAHGNFNTTVNVSSNDEVAQLAKSFNHMIIELKNSDKKLRNMNLELENRVNERTKELELINKELDKRVKDEVSKRSRQEQLLIQQSRFAAMGEMIGNIAHQWRQPLNALGLLLQNVENAYEMDMLDEEYIKRTVDKGTLLTNTMSKTIDDFRDFFKPNKQMEIFRVSSVIKSTFEIIGASFSNNMIKFEQSIDESLCIKGFSNEFSQVLLNILNNAKDELIAMDGVDKVVFLRVYKKDNFVEIEIEDNAGGIKESILDKVFDPYFTTKDEGKGTGIGLYMSKTIIEHNMHGKLKVKNGENGAIFSIELAVAQCFEDVKVDK